MNTDNVWKHQYIGGHICLTQYIGVHSNMFGGELLKFIDETAALFASFLIQDRQVVTKKFGDTVFHNPIKVGDLIMFYGKIIHIGNTSLTLNIEVQKHNPRNGKQKIVGSTDVVFVRIDSDGSPTNISERLKNKYKDQYENNTRSL